ncbi:hypothetical protein GOEFS_059_00030 [Gordonia effusa NBRC 100432]|uniref:Lipoprotein n=1 Tax=Gordonia effusa NBRC 100432 TaxID=1077974 RepID=H0R0G8_9ACTN|nr:hypothetical protein [Gordonia effusa]GAB18569.1 hypothetical protein GOEFS_059_00030 [Gordonia effusa NBRC 100432]
MAKQPYIRASTVLAIATAIGIALSTSACSSNSDGGAQANAEQCVQVHNVVNIANRTAVAKAVDVVAVIEQVKLGSAGSDGAALPDRTAAFTAKPVATIKGRKPTGTTRFVYDDFKKCGGGVKEQLKPDANYLVYGKGVGQDLRVWKVEELTDAQIRAVVQRDDSQTPAAVRDVRNAVNEK